MIFFRLLKQRTTVEEKFQKLQYNNKIKNKNIKHNKKKK